MSFILGFLGMISAAFLTMWATSRIEANALATMVFLAGIMVVVFFLYYIFASTEYVEHFRENQARKKRDKGL